MALLCEWIGSALVAGLDCSGLRRADQGPGGGCAHRHHPGAVRLDSPGSLRTVDVSEAFARTCDHRPDQSSLVCSRAAGGGAAFLGQLFRVSQSSAPHQRGERPSAALVVFRACAGGGVISLHPAAGLRAGTGDCRFRGRCFLAAHSRPRQPRPFRRLLVAGGVSAVHCSGNQVAQLLASCHTCRRLADRFDRSSPVSSATQGFVDCLVFNGALHSDPVGWSAGIAPLDSTDSGSGDAHPAG